LYHSTRRSVYLPILRSALYEPFHAFDFPDPAVSNGDRATTTVASQALFMMNSPLLQTAPRHLADILLGPSNDTEADRMQKMALGLLGRTATGDEIKGWSEFLDRYQAAPSLVAECPETRQRLAWQGLCRSLMASNEFLYVD
jgi:hypothetical protein